MIETQFYLQNTHFALSLFAAFVFFAVTWLHFDAWLGKKAFLEFIKIAGFFLVSLSFLVNATVVEQTVLVNSVFGNGLTLNLAVILRFLGYCALVYAMFKEPLQAKPEEHTSSKELSAVVVAGGALPLPLLMFSLPPLAIIVSFLYLRRATIGLENHLKPVSFGLAALSLYELLSLAILFRNTNNVSLFNVVMPFAPLWIITHIILFIAVFILALWVFGYLLKRIQTQLFMVFIVAILSIFLVTTVAFTGLLLANLKTDVLSNLKTNVSVLNYSIQSKRAETLSDAQVVAQNPQIQKAILENDRKVLREITTSILLAKNESFVIITSTNGAVLMRADDSERVGDSISNDPVFKQTAKGEEVSSTVVEDGILAPIVSIRSGVPVMKEGSFIGTVLVGTHIDNAFVDGLKKATNLEVSVYGGNVRSATTFISQDGKSRWVGIREETQNIKNQVLREGKEYTGSVSILNIPYLGAFSPLTDMDEAPVGMLFVGREQTHVLQSAGRAIEMTFLITVLLIIASVFITYFVSKYITDQIK